MYSLVARRPGRPWNVGLVVGCGRGADRDELALAALDALPAAAVRGLALLEVELAVALRTLFSHRGSVPTDGAQVMLTASFMPAA